MDGDTTSQIDGRVLLAEHLANKKHAEFADKVGCSVSHLSLILSGRRYMSLRLAKMISAESGIPIEVLPHRERGVK